MKSITKNLLSNNQIKKLVKINFGEKCEVGNIKELKGGMFNAIYLIERVNENDKVVLKVGAKPGIPLLTYEKDIMPTEVECFRLISEHTTVPTPKVLASDFSKKHIESNYFFMSAMEGATLMKTAGKMDKYNLDKVRTEIAGYFAQIHQIKGDYFGYFTVNKKCQYSTWKDAFFNMYGQLLKDAKERKIKLPYERIEQSLRKNSKFLEHIKEPSLVDFDCHEGNIFVKKVEEEYQIEGILDFERAFWGDPIADFAGSFIIVDDIRKQKPFLSGYLKASKKIKEYTQDDAIRYQLYRMYLFTIMATETFRFGFVFAIIQGTWAKSTIKKCLKVLEG